MTPLRCGRARQMEVHHHPLPTLSLEDLLLHLTIHIRKHRFVGLRWLVDVSELLRGYGEALDWDYLARTARRAGAGTLFYVTLHLSQERWGPVPVPVMQSLQPGHVRRWLLRPSWMPRCRCGPYARAAPSGAGSAWARSSCWATFGRSAWTWAGVSHPHNSLPEQASSAGWLADLRFHGQRLVTIALRVVRMAWRRITTGTNRLP
ncbi:MAG: nucleotidyltransferase family protein [Anaerolineae bacterium]|nr:MAG: nucleotidyltransferase family protein [Anaerolineae bacterium]